VRRPRARALALVVGTVERRKNLLRAVELLPAVPNWNSSRSDRRRRISTKVRARVAELGLGERVTLLGYVGRAELDTLYAKATLALVPSRYEGFGYALGEALCAGLPVRRARSSSLVEVAGEDAPLIDPDDNDGWVDAVREIIDDRDAAEERPAGVRPRPSRALAGASRRRRRGDLRLVDR